MKDRVTGMVMGKLAGRAEAKSLETKVKDTEKTLKVLIKESDGMALKQAWVAAVIISIATGQH